MNKIWFSSDFHYAHKNITRGISVWDDKENTTRDFENVHQMNDALVNSINKYVQQDDTLYFLGDWSFDGIENIYNFWNRLICKDIKFIPGNHDNHIKKLTPLPRLYFEYMVGIVSEEPRHDHFRLANSSDLFRILPELTTLIINEKKIILSHYPIEQWEDMEKGSIMLHGHCHHKIDNFEINTKYKRMDVGIDWKEFRPYCLEEILKIMSKREIYKHLS